ncbi:sensor histidine kinase [Marinifilum flexuosum]|uniref:sensor histidine kinase n=1 Tax=Marinifilum flexuosum TaxID=1117708 RepID=UPI002490526B|nr:histidine kinase [Marinifilum flexuosum]
MNLIIKTQLTILLLFLAAFKGIAAYSSTGDFTQLDGLPCNSVNHIFEDSRGMIWLATDAGLCEFNGFEVKYRKELNRLQGEKVTSITENKNGNLIISATGVGVCEFDGEHLEVISTQENNELYDIRSVKALDNELIVGTSDGIYLSDVLDKLGEFSLVKGTKGLNILETVSNNNAVIIFPKLEQKAYKFESSSFSKIVNGKPQVLEFGKKFYGEIGVGQQAFLVVDSQRVRCDVLNVLSNQNERVILLRYIKNGLQFRKLISIRNNICVDLLAENDLDDVFVQCVFKNSLMGDIWLGTKNHGLISLKQSIFELYDVSSLVPDCNEIVDLLSYSDGSIVVAGRNGIAKIKNEKVIKSINQKEFIKLLPKSKKKKELIINDIELKGNTIWVATNCGFYTWNCKSFLLTYKNISVATNFIITSNGNLFCYNGSQFYTCGIRDNSVDTKWNLSKGEEVELTKIIEFDSYIWVATETHGIYRFGENKVKKFGRNNIGIHNVVNDMLVLPDSSIIVGGNNGIIYKLKSEGDELMILDSLDQSDGLEGISVHGFQYHKDGSIWCGTNIGVHRFEYKTWQPDSVVKYRFWNANKKVEFRGKESVVDRYDNIWVKSNYALMKIEANDFINDNAAYKPTLLEVKVKDSNWRLKKSEFDKWTKTPNNPIHLSYHENYYRLHYGMLYCDALENIRYRYRLLGFDNRWSDWVKSDEVVYSNLRGGEYTFEIEARKLSSGKLGQYSIDIILESAWWKTVWFWFIVISILGVLTYYAIQLFKSRVQLEEKQRTKQFNRVIGLKIRALQYQLDPHFVFNSLNSIQSYILEDDEDKALEYLSDFSMVLRNNINNANKNLISLSEEVAYLKLYLKLEQMRFEEKFTFQINLDDKINSLDIKIPPMLIQPFLEHAIRNGISKLDKIGKIVIRFILEEDGYLKCEITDDGLGNRKIDVTNAKSELVKGNSLQITCDRMKLLNKVLTNGKTYSYQINECVDSKTNFSGVKTVLGFPRLEL